MKHRLGSGVLRRNSRTQEKNSFEDVAGDGAGGGDVDGVDVVGAASRAGNLFGQVRSDVSSGGDVGGGLVVFEGPLLFGSLNLAKVVDAGVSLLLDEGLDLLGLLGLGTKGLVFGGELLLGLLCLGLLGLKSCKLGIELFVLRVQALGFGAEFESFLAVLAEFGEFFTGYGLFFEVVVFPAEVFDLAGIGGEAGDLGFLRFVGGEKEINAAKEQDHDDPRKCGFHSEV
jgi:hypothetical protein